MEEFRLNAGYVTHLSVYAQQITRSVLELQKVLSTIEVEHRIVDINSTDMAGTVNVTEQNMTNMAFRTT